MKTVYIAGKITGDKHYKAKFEAAKAELEKRGYIVLTPSVLPRWQDSADLCNR